MQGMSTRDVRRVEDRGTSALDACWLVQVDDVYFPICSFGSGGRALVILFLEEVRVADPTSAGREFWKPWLDRSLPVAQLVVGLGDPLLAHREPAMVWKVVDGRVEPDVLMTPAAHRKAGPWLVQLAAAVRAAIEGLAGAEQQARAVHRVLSEHHHRLARLRHPHRWQVRPPPQEGSSGQSRTGRKLRG